MTEPAPTVNRSAYVVSTLFFALAVVIAASWIAGWFFTPRPGWSTGLGGVGFVCVVLGSTVRKMGGRPPATPPGPDA